MSPTVVITKHSSTKKASYLQSSIIPSIITSYYPSDTATIGYQINHASDNSMNESAKYVIKPLNLEGGQCIWCGKYGHKRRTCPLLK